MTETKTTAQTEYTGVAGLPTFQSEAEIDRNSAAIVDTGKKGLQAAASGLSALGNAAGSTVNAMMQDNYQFKHTDNPNIAKFYQEYKDIYAHYQLISEIATKDPNFANATDTEGKTFNEVFVALKAEKQKTVNNFIDFDENWETKTPAVQQKFLTSMQPYLDKIAKDALPLDKRYAIQLAAATQPVVVAQVDLPPPPPPPPHQFVNTAVRDIYYADHDIYKQELQLSGALSGTDYPESTWLSTATAKSKEIAGNDTTPYLLNLDKNWATPGFDQKAATNQLNYDKAYLANLKEKYKAKLDAAKAAADQQAALDAKAKMDADAKVAEDLAKAKAGVDEVGKKTGNALNSLGKSMDDTLGHPTAGGIGGTILGALGAVLLGSVSGGGWFGTLIGLLAAPFLMFLGAKFGKSTIDPMFAKSNANAPANNRFNNDPNARFRQPEIESQTTQDIYKVGMNRDCPPNQERESDNHGFPEPQSLPYGERGMAVGHQRFR